MVVFNRFTSLLFDGGEKKSGEALDLFKTIFIYQYEISSETTSQSRQIFPAFLQTRFRTFDPLVTISKRIVENECARTYYKEPLSFIEILKKQKEKTVYLPPESKIALERLKYLPEFNGYVQLLSPVCVQPYQYDVTAERLKGVFHNLETDMIEKIVNFVENTSPSLVGDEIKTAYTGVTILNTDKKTDADDYFSSQKSQTFECYLAVECVKGKTAGLHSGSINCGYRDSQLVSKYEQLKKEKHAKKNSRLYILPKMLDVDSFSAKTKAGKRLNRVVGGFPVTFPSGIKKRKTIRSHRRSKKTLKHKTVKHRSIFI
jgi:hypothetical protein